MFYFIITLLLFGSMEVVSKPLMGEVGAVEITLYRFALGFLMLFVLLIFSKKISTVRSLSVKTWVYIAALGITNTFISMSFLQLAVKHTTVAETVIIFSSNPLLVMLLSFFLKLEQFSYIKLLALFLGLTGMIIIVDPQSFVLGGGTLYACGASLAFAIYTIGSKKVLTQTPPIIFNTISIFFGVVALGLFTALSGGRLMPPAHLWHDREALLALLYLGIFVSGIGYITFMEAIKQLGAITASFIFILKPAVAVVLALIFLSEELSIHLIVGMILILSSLIVIIREKKKLRF